MAVSFWPFSDGPRPLLEVYPSPKFLVSAPDLENIARKFVVEYHWRYLAKRWKYPPGWVEVKSHSRATSLPPAPIFKICRTKKNRPEGGYVVVVPECPGAW